MDMQDQPRYEALEPADKKTLPDGQASRPLVEGTVPRMPAGQAYVDRQTEYFYTGVMAAGGAAQGAATGTTVPASSTAGGAASNPATNAGDANARGQVMGPGNNTQQQQQGAARLGGPDVFPFPITMAELERGRDRYNNFCSMCHGLTGESDGMIVRRGFQRPPSFHDPGLQEGQASAAHYFQTITNGLGAMPSYSYMIPPEDRWKIIAYIRAMQLARKGTVDDVPADKRARLSSANQDGTQKQQQPAHGGEQH